MAFSVNNYYSGSWVDLSDYIIDASEVPYVSRNRDWTMRLENWSVKIAGSLKSIRGSSYNFAVGDKFTVKDGSTFLFLGEVYFSYYNYDEQVYEVDIKSALSILQDYSCDYDTLHSYFIDRNNWYEYTSRDYDDNRILGITWAIEKMFEIAGLTLNASTANASVLFNDSNVGFGDILLREMLIDEDMFYCLGQSVAAIHSDSTVDVTLIPTFFEFISEMCAVFGLMFQPTNADSSGNFTYTLVLETSNYTIGNDDKYNFIEKNIKGNYKLVFSGCEYGYASVRSYYRSGTHDIDRYIVGGLDRKVNYFLNLYIFYSDIPLITGSWFTITNIIPQGDPEKWTVTATGHTFNNGDYVIIENVNGMTDLNGNKYLVSGVTTNTFDIIDSTVQTYTSGGDVIELQNNTYRDLTPNYNPEHLSDTWNPIYYKMLADVGDSVTNDYQQEEIECPYNITFNTVAENFIDIENRTSRIIQETY